MGVGYRLDELEGGLERACKGGCKSREGSKKSRGD